MVVFKDLPLLMGYQKASLDMFATIKKIFSSWKILLKTYVIPVNYSVGKLPNEFISLLKKYSLIIDDAPLSMVQFLIEYPGGD